MKRNFLHMNKRGSPLDLFWLMVGILAFVFVFFVGYNIFQSYRDTAYADSSDTAKEVMASGDASYQAFDNMFVIIIAGGIISLFISGLLISTNSAFAIVFIIVGIFAIVISGTLSNTYEQFSNTSEMSNTRDTMKITNYSMLHYPVIILLFVIAFVLGLYAKERVL